jgi:hypothetical protein
LVVCPIFDPKLNLNLIKILNIITECLHPLRPLLLMLSSLWIVNQKIKLKSERDFSSVQRILIEYESIFSMCMYTVSSHIWRCPNYKKIFYKKERNFNAFLCVCVCV